MIIVADKNRQKYLALDSESDLIISDLQTSLLGDGDGASMTRSYNAYIDLVLRYTDKTSKIAKGDYILASDGDMYRSYVVDNISISSNGNGVKGHTITVQGMDELVYRANRKTLAVGVDYDDAPTVKELLNVILGDIDCDIILDDDANKSVQNGAESYSLEQGSSRQSLLVQVIADYEIELLTYVKVKQGSYGRLQVHVSNRHGSEVVTKRYDYGHNIKNISRTISSDSFATRFYLVGKDGITPKPPYIDFSDANDKYNDGGDPIEMTLAFAEIDNVYLLADYAREYVEKNKIAEPTVAYQVDIYSGEELPSLGDSVQIVDRDINVYSESRVLQRYYSLTSPQNNGILLGDYAPINLVTPIGLDKQIKDLTKVIDKKVKDLTDVDDGIIKDIDDIKTDVDGIKDLDIPSVLDDIDKAIDNVDKNVDNVINLLNGDEQLVVYDKGDVVSDKVYTLGSTRLDVSNASNNILGISTNGKSVGYTFNISGYNPEHDPIYKKMSIGDKMTLTFSITDLINTGTTVDRQNYYSLTLNPPSNNLSVDSVLVNGTLVGNSLPKTVQVTDYGYNETKRIDVSVTLRVNSLTTLDGKDLVGVMLTTHVLEQVTSGKIRDIRLVTPHGVKYIYSKYKSVTYSEQNMGLNTPYGTLMYNTQVYDGKGKTSPYVTKDDLNNAISNIGGGSTGGGNVINYDDSEIKADVEKLNTDVGDIKYDVNNVKSDVSGVKSDVNNVKSDITSIQGRLNAVETKNTSQDNKIQGIIDQLSGGSSGGGGTVISYDDSELRGRVETLEQKEDKDTIYDDSVLKERVEKLEQKEDKDTIYDDSVLKERVAVVEQKIVDIGSGSSGEVDEELKNNVYVMKSDMYGGKYDDSTKVLYTYIDYNNCEWYADNLLVDKTLRYRDNVDTATSDRLSGIYFNRHSDKALSKDSYYTYTFKTVGVSPKTGKYITSSSQYVYLGGATDTWDMTVSCNGVLLTADSNGRYNAPNNTGYYTDWSVTIKRNSDDGSTKATYTEVVYMRLDTITGGYKTSNYDFILGDVYINGLMVTDSWSNTRISSYDYEFTDKLKKTKLSWYTQDTNKDSVGSYPVKVITDAIQDKHIDTLNSLTDTNDKVVTHLEISDGLGVKLDGSSVSIVDGKAIMVGIGTDNKTSTTASTVGTVVYKIPIDSMGDIGYGDTVNVKMTYKTSDNYPLTSIQDNANTKVSISVGSDPRLPNNNLYYPGDVEITYGDSKKTSIKSNKVTVTGKASMVYEYDIKIDGVDYTYNQGIDPHIYVAITSLATISATAWYTAKGTLTVQSGVTYGNNMSTYSTIYDATRPITSIIDTDKGLKGIYSIPSNSDSIRDVIDVAKGYSNVISNLTDMVNSLQSEVEKLKGQSTQDLNAHWSIYQGKLLPTNANSYINYDSLTQTYNWGHDSTMASQALYIHDSELRTRYWKNGTKGYYSFMIEPGKAISNYTIPKDIQYKAGSTYYADTGDGYELYVNDTLIYKHDGSQSYRPTINLKLGQSGTNSLSATSITAYVASADNKYTITYITGKITMDYNTYIHSLNDSMYYGSGISSYFTTSNLTPYSDMYNGVTNYNWGYVTSIVPSTSGAVVDKLSNITVGVIDDNGNKVICTDYCKVPSHRLDAYKVSDLSEYTGYNTSYGNLTKSYVYKYHSPK